MSRGRSAVTARLGDSGDQGQCREELCRPTVAERRASVPGLEHVDRPWTVDGLFGVRPVVTAPLSADHGATDGAVGARHLTAVTRLLQNPEQL
ncbi:2-oxo acid dehydrogenase subunit E2 [Streptomyces sp. NPDC050121]|uniref:2-oxo acid dehydrogenase subunit E2 n=1 Tax=Streptomyces sp. NPDC050121 TaxID=3365601 RepID=UPI00378EF4E3